MRDGGTAGQWGSQNTDIYWLSSQSYMGAVHGAPITIAASKTTDHRSPQRNNNRKLRNITKTIKMRYKVSNCFWKNSTNPLWCEVATGLQYVKKKKN